MSSVRFLREGYAESLRGERKGDKPSETSAIVDFLKNSTVGVVTSKREKYSAVSNVLKLFGIKSVWLKLERSELFDLTPFPAYHKALAGRYLSDEAELFLARGRLSVPGSGACTLLVDRGGHIISAVSSPPHHLHGFPVEVSLWVDTFNLLLRLGMKPLPHRGITEKTLTVYSTMTPFELFGLISERKFRPFAEFLKRVKPERVLIVGGYLDGLFFFKLLKDFPFVKELHLLDVSLQVYRLFELEGLEVGGKTLGVYDLVVDLTGFGGIDELPAEAEYLIVEKPHTEWTKEVKTDARTLFLTSKTVKGSLGTMSLAVKIARRASELCEEKFKLFYCVPNLLNFESLLFNAENPEAFLFFSRTYPLLTASAPREFAPEPRQLDAVVVNEVKRLTFSLIKA